MIIKIIQIYKSTIKVRVIFLMTLSVQIFTVIILLTVNFNLISSKLQIQSPSALRQYFDKKYNGNGIPYSIANFGDVPYGKSIIGQIEIPTVLQNCIYEDVPIEGKIKKVMLSERNDCKFTQKALNAQKQGAIMSIIMDNKMQNPGSIIMVDDGHGAEIHIPTVLISMQDGQKILNEIETGKVTISISFDTNKTDKIQMSIFLDIADRNNFVFIRKFASYFQRLKDYIDLKISYATISCKSCPQTDCFCDNAYCKKILYAWVPNAGQIFIKQQLREYFIYKKYPSVWWTYMNSFDNECSMSFGQDQIEDCSIQIMNKLNINSKDILNSVQNSFVNGTNSILQESFYTRLYSQVIVYPSVIVNNVTYRGNMEAYELFQFSCNSLKNQPEACGEPKPIQPPNIVKWVVIGVILFLIFTFFVVFFYRRVVRRQLSKNMNRQVNQLVNQYITMYEAQKFNGDIQLKQKTKDEQTDS